MSAAACGILLCGLLGACAGGKEGNLILVGQGGSQVSSGEEALCPSPVGGLADNVQGSGSRAGLAQGAVETQAGTAGVQEGADSGTGAGEGCGFPDSGSAWEESEEPRIYVHVCGAVANPGVYALAQGSRGEDALLAAGGFSQDADQDYVNLAKPVTDGEKLYFPDREETAGRSLMDLGTGGTEDTAGSLVDINHADRETLCTLPGIGASRAEDIIAYRESHGAFQKCEDIKKVSGIKDSVYEKIKDKITAN